MDNKSLIICRCEEVSYHDLLETASTFKCTPRELKLRTRAGMGYCGGRVCRLMIESIAYSQIKKPMPNETTLKYQPPIRPISFAELGGEE